MTLAVLTIACTPFSEAQLDDWFVYHTASEEQLDRYRAVGDAFSATWAAIDDAHRERRAAHEAAQDDGIEMDIPFHAPLDTITKLAWRFKLCAAAIGANCPDGADKMAAVRSLRLAYNATNEALHGQKLPGGNYQTIAREQLTAARWQANAAIACLWRPPAVAREHGAVQALALELDALHTASIERNGRVFEQVREVKDILSNHSDRLFDLDARVGEFDGKVFDAEEILPGGPGPEANEALGLGGVDGDVVAHDDAGVDDRPVVLLTAADVLGDLTAAELLGDAPIVGS
jgi:hypothetical protein